MKILAASGWAHSGRELEKLIKNIIPEAKVSLFSYQEFDSSSYVTSYLEKFEELKPDLLFSWSTGGLLSLELLCNFQVRTVLLSPFARAIDEGSYKGGITKSSMRLLKSGVSSATEEALSEFFSNSMFPLSVNSEELAEFKENALKIGKNKLLDGLSYLEQTDLRDRLTEIKADLLLLHGAQDRIISPEASSFINKAVPNSRRVLFGSLGHGLAYTDFRELRSAVLEFLD